MSLFKLFSKNKIPLIPTFRSGFSQSPFGKRGGRAIISFSFFFFFFFSFSLSLSLSLSLGLSLSLSLSLYRFFNL